MTARNAWQEEADRRWPDTMHVVESDRPVWRCDRCQRRITGNAGSISISYPEIAQHRADEERWTREHPGSCVDGADLATYPDPVRWRVLHDACRVDGGDYWIGTGDVQSWRGVAEWTAHLLGKTWLPVTDWDAVLRRAGAR